MLKISNLQNHPINFRLFQTGLNRQNTQKMPFLCLKTPQKIAFLPRFLQKTVKICTFSPKKWAKKQ